MDFRKQAEEIARKSVERASFTMSGILVDWDHTAEDGRYIYVEALADAKISGGEIEIDVVPETGWVEYNDGTDGEDINPDEFLTDAGLWEKAMEEMRAKAMPSVLASIERLFDSEVEAAIAHYEHDAYDKWADR